MERGLAADLIPILQRSPALAGLAADAVEDLARVMREVVLPSDTVLTEEGESGDELFVVLHGSVVAATTDAAGQPRVLAELRPGDIAGEVAALIGGRRTATLRSRDAAVLAVLDGAGLRELRQRRPEVVDALRRVSVARLQRSELAASLDQLFGAFDAQALDELQSKLSWLDLPAGSVLFREGDPGDALFIVLAGRLRVATLGAEADAQSPQDIGRGDIVGELAVLTHGRRSATVYAVRDSHLARLGVAEFDALMATHPVAMGRVARLVAERLLHATTAVPRRPPPSTAFAIVPITPGAPQEVAIELGAMLGPAGRTRVVQSDDVAAMLGPNVLEAAPGDPAGNWLTHWLDEVEAASDALVCVGDRRFPEWTARCVRRSDHVLLLADAAADPGSAPPDTQLGGTADGVSPTTTLILLHPPGTAEPRGTGRWLRGRRVDMHLHVRRSVRGDLERAARILSGRAVSVVLGGGGARGFAHIGVLQALEDAGIPVDLVGGTSMGALVGSAPAMGWSATKLHHAARPLSRGLFDVTFPLVSLLRGRRIGRAIRALVGDRDIEDLVLPYFCVSTNLTRAEEVVHRRGSVALAVRASLSLPGVLPPVRDAGDLLVDGGLLNNVPADVMRASNNGGRVIAVDVSPTVDLRVPDAFAPDVSGWSLLAARLRRRAHPRLPSILTLLNRAAVAPSVHRRTHLDTRLLADLYLQVPTAEWGFLEFGAIDELVARGRTATIDQLRAWWAHEQR